MEAMAAMEAMAEMEGYGDMEDEEEDQYDEDLKALEQSGSPPNQKRSKRQG